jgi:hypothetical protein
MLGRGALPDPAQHVELARPADERCPCAPALADRCRSLEGEPRLDGRGLALRDHGLDSLVDDRVPREPVRLRADEDAVRRCRALQPRCRVDDVTRHHRLAELGPCVERDERLAGVDRDAQLQVESRARAQLVDALPHRERGADRAFRVVAECRGRPEDAHHRVADELLD